MVKYNIYNYTESAVEKTTCISFPWTESAASSSSMASHAAASLGYLGLSSQFSVVSIRLTSACVVGAVRGYRWAPSEHRVLAGFSEHDDHPRSRPAGSLVVHWTRDRTLAPARPTDAVANFVRDSQSWANMQTAYRTKRRTRGEVYIRWIDVTESMVTIRSSFGGYNLA